MMIYSVSGTVETDQIPREVDYVVFVGEDEFYIHNIPTDRLNSNGISGFFTDHLLT